MVVPAAGGQSNHREDGGKDAAEAVEISFGLQLRFARMLPTKMSEHLAEERLIELATNPNVISEREDSHIENCSTCLEQLVKLIKQLEVN